MNQNISVSVITSTLNSKFNLIKTISSVQQQTYLFLDHIIIDGLSTDNTVEIIPKAPLKKILFVSESDNGIYDAFNKGIKRSNADYLIFLGAGDIFANNNIVKNIVEIINKNDPDIIYSDLNFYKNEYNNISRVWKSKSFKFYKLYLGWMPPHCTVFFKRNTCFNKISFSTKYKISSDYDLLVKLIKTKKLRIHYYESVTVFMQDGGISNHGFINFFRKLCEDYKIIKENKIGGLLTLLLKRILKIKDVFIY